MKAEHKPSSGGCIPVTALRRTFRARRVSEGLPIPRLRVGLRKKNALQRNGNAPSSGGTVDERILFSYDVFGNRIEHDVDPTGGGTYTTTKYAYDPSGNAWADLSSGGTLQVRRIYADAMDALVYKIDSGDTKWMLTDAIGSVRDIANGSGSLIDHRDWDTFGNLTYESSSANGDRYGFREGYMD